MYLLQKLSVFCIICMIIGKICAEVAENDSAKDSNGKMPRIVVVTLFRNKAHVLPYFFSYFETLNYPKDRISLWFRSDHNEDVTLGVLKYWLSSNSHLYHSVDFDYDNSEFRRETERSIAAWPIERHRAVIKLKEKGLDYARHSWADFVFFLDADSFLVDRDTLNKLIAAKEQIIAPMLVSDSLYSNFWCGMSKDFYYERTDDYKLINSFEKRGIFSVPMIHSAVLINLNDVRSDYLTFNKTKLQEKLGDRIKVPDNVPEDDIIVFALSANFSNIPLRLTNDVYGFGMVPLDPHENLKTDLEQLTNIKLHIINELDGGLVLNKSYEQFVHYPQDNWLTLDKIFMINLPRRPERYQKMHASFRELGLVVEDFEAVDGAELTDEKLASLEIKFLPGYADPYHNRPMTRGEIGCFLSHYFIWKQMIRRKLDQVLILEDDIRFEPNFVEKATAVIHEARRMGGWELIYFGRKRLEDQDEEWVRSSKALVYPSYSYWTLGYVLTIDGARKLIDANPMEKLLPVDEFLPIMFNRHVNPTWMEHFENRNLMAWSASPLLLFPTYYTGDDGFISDTEDSLQINMNNELMEAHKKKGNREWGRTKYNEPFEYEKNSIKAAIEKLLAESRPSTDEDDLHSEL